jgi:hypothetical protein
MDLHKTRNEVWHHFIAPALARAAILYRGGALCMRGTYAGFGLVCIFGIR